MSNANWILASCVCGLLIACGDYAGGEQGSTARNTSREASSSGSATDIVSEHGSGIDTNAPNAADIGIGGTPQRQSGNYQSEPLPSQSSDEELAKQIKVAITTGSMGTTGAIAENQLTRIDVRVQNGAVTLRGPVSSQEERRVIEKQVAGMKGVRSVQNQLTVGNDPTKDNALDSVVPRSPGNQ